MRRYALQATNSIYFLGMYSNEIRVHHTFVLGNVFEAWSHLF